MAFCSFSSELVAKNSVTVDNIFINEFMPIAPESCVKVYLFGLYNCNNTNSLDNSLEAFSRILNLSEEDVISAFTYWQTMGLVQILNITPIEVRYLPVKKSSAMLLKINKDKYKSFNTQAQEILHGRMITPTEYNEYYYVMESLHIEQDALIMIIKYCADLKGENVGYKYILTVAKNWAYAGITTAEKVEDRLMGQQAVDSEMKIILKELGIRRAASIEDYQLYLEWTDQMGFEVESLVYLAKRVKKIRGGVKRLDYLVNKFYQMRLLSIKEIEGYLVREDELYTIAKEVCKNIGVRYENLEIVIETYVNNWDQFGFDFDTLSVISKHCFKIGLRSLQSVNTKIIQFYKLGLVSKESIENHIENSKQLDKKIEAILKSLGILRYVNNYDRAFYNTWFFEWEISQELLDYAVEQSVGKVQPVQFLNKLLSIYHSKKIKTVEQAKKEKVEFIQNSYTKAAPKAKPKTAKNKVKTNEYSQEDLNALFTSIDEVQI